MLHRRAGTFSDQRSYRQWYHVTASTMTVTIMLLFTHGRELLVTKKRRYTEGRELSVTTLTRAPTVSGAEGGEHHIGDYKVTVHTRRGIIGV
jgi:hypothetical protein